MAEQVVPAKVLRRWEIGQGLTLVQIPFSPFAIPVQLMLAGAGAPHHVLNLAAWDRRAVLELTGGAYYAVPVVVDADRSSPVVVYESRDDAVEVARYVDTKLRLGLFPPEMDGLNQILIQYVEGQIEDLGFRLNDIYLLPAIPDLAERGMAIRHKERKFGKGCLDQWRDQKEQLQVRLEELLAPLDQMLSQHSFLTGERPLYADYALAGVLGDYTYTGDNEVPRALVNLRRWYEALPNVKLPLR
jgi:glutathione S-transferase